MSKKIVKIKYTGSALPGNAEVVSLFDTTVSCPRGWATNANLHTYHVNIKHDQTGTVKGYKSEDGGTNWYQFYDSGVLAIPTYTSDIVQSIEGMRDFKFTWTNGANPQTAFAVSQDCSVYP